MTREGTFPREWLRKKIFQMLKTIAKRAGAIAMVVGTT
jgi:hypothetical protein